MRKAVVILSNNAVSCQECGCQCNTCSKNTAFDLDSAHRLEELHAQVREKEAKLNRTEVALHNARENSEQEIGRLQEELNRLKDRHDRLYESHKKLQKVNSSLEDNLLSVVNRSEEQKVQMQHEVATLSARLIEVTASMSELQQEAEECREDCAVAVHLLQNRPSQYLNHKLTSLPIDIQARVRAVLPAPEEESSREQDNEERKIRVPMQTFPPCAMVYSINKQQEATTAPSPPPDSVPVSVVSQILSRKLGGRRTHWTFVCGKCRAPEVKQEQAVQTERNRLNSDSL